MTHAFPTQHSASAVARAARLVCAMTAFAPVLAAWAQSATAPAAPAAAAAEESASTQTVTVTARKREERGQDVPQSLNVVSGAALENSGVTQLEELQFRIPGLKVVNSVGLSNLAIRGVSNNAGERGGAPSSAVHLDGVYLPRPVLALSEVFDLDRVEVLKGPEGTLYGRNATAGVVNYLTRDPRVGSTFDGFLGAGSFGLKRAQAGFNVQLGEGQGVRVSAVRTKDDGYTQNIGGGGDVDARDFSAVRLKGVFMLTPAVQLKLMVQGSDGGGNQGYGASHNPATKNAYVFQSGAPQRDSERRIRLDTPMDVSNRGTIVSAALSAGLGNNLEFKSITGYVGYRGRYAIDADGVGGFIENSTGSNRSTFVSQEFQLSGRLGSSLSWTSGLYFSRERTSGDGLTEDSNFYPDDLTPFTYFQGVYESTARNVAAFGEVTWQFAEKTALLVGARQTRESQRGSASGGLLDFATFQLVPFSGNIDISASRFTPKVLLQHRLDKNAMVYASATTGFKSGGFNPTPPVAAYQPEKIKAYEIGTKMSAAGGRIELDAAAFYYDYSDLQLRTLNTVTNQTAVSNVSKAAIQGAEFTLVVRPSRDLTLDLNAAYVDSALKNYISPYTKVDMSGSPMPMAPKVSATAGAEYRMALGGGMLTMRAEVNHQSTVIFPAFIDTTKEREGPVTLVNANLRYNLAGGKTYVSLIGRNLTDKLYQSNRVYYRGFYDLQSFAPPRTIEVRLGTRF
jgi:iron complex outermembrane receptor protein